MKKRMGVFFVILVGTLFVSTQLLEYMVRSRYQRMPEAIYRDWSIAKEEKNTIDVLVLGDSESYTSFSPMQLWQEKGISAYICGQAGQHIAGTYYTLKRALKYQQPKLVLLETNVMFRYEGHAEALGVSMAEATSYYCPLFRYHNAWKGMCFGKENLKQGDYKGFQIRKAVEPYCQGEYMKQTEQEENIPKLVRFYMREIIKLCNKNQIKLLLVSAPSPQNYNYKKHNAIRKFAGQQGVAYLDLNLEQERLAICWEEDSMDKGDHLNLYGAQKVTEYLGEYLTKQYEIPNHKNDPKYKSWNQLAQVYEESVNKKGDCQKGCDGI